jgi:hypothetical protein
VSSGPIPVNVLYLDSCKTATARLAVQCAVLGSRTRFGARKNWSRWTLLQREPILPCIGVLVKGVDETVAFPPFWEEGMSRVSRL